MNSLIRIFIYSVLFSILMDSCNVEDFQFQDQMPVFDLKKLSDVKKLTLSDLGVKEVIYIPLETNEDCVAPGIKNVIFGNDFFLVQFYTIVLKYRNDGKFISKIGDEGRGPNEFTVVHDIDIDKKDERIYLADGWQKKILVYSGNGNIIKTIPIPVSSKISFKLTEDGILCYNMNQFADVKNSYLLIDTIGRVIREYPNIYSWELTQTNTSIMDENLFYRYNEKLFKKEIYSDTIYEFEKKEFKPHVVISHGEKLLTPSYRSALTHSQLVEKYIMQKRLLEFGDFIYYEFMDDFKRGGDNYNRGIIGSRSGGALHLINADIGLINDLDGGPNIQPKTVKEDKTLVSWIDATQLKNYVATTAFKTSKPKYPEKKRELEELATNLRETDNPVLILSRLVDN